MWRRSASKRTGIAIALVLALIAIGWTFLSAQLPKAVDATAAAARAASLQLDSTFSAAFAGEMLAARTGLFDQAGLALRLEPGSPDIDPIQLVATGARTIGVTSATKFALARAKGAAVVGFAAGYLESPVVLYVLESSGIRTPADFRARSVNVKAGDDTAIILEALMAKLGLPRSQVRETAVASPLASLLDGEIDIWPSAIVPAAHELERKGARYRIIKPGNYGLHVPGTVYFASETMVRDHPELVTRILRAIIAGWERVYADVDKSIPLIAGFDEALTADVIRFDLAIQREFVRPMGRRFGEFDDTQWRALSQILQQQKLLRTPIDLAKSVSFEFLRDAYRKPSAYGKPDPVDPSLFGPLIRRQP